LKREDLLVYQFVRWVWGQRSGLPIFHVVLRGDNILIYRFSRWFRATKIFQYTAFSGRLKGRSFGLPTLQLAAVVAADLLSIFRPPVHR